MIKKLKFITLAAALSIVTFSSCSLLRPRPIVPDFVEDVSPSWDGEEKNSGLLGYIDGQGYLITPSAAARYTWLTEYYSKDYNPALKSGVGLNQQKDGNFILSTQYMVEFVVMNKKYKSNILPKNLQINE